MIGEILYITILSLLYSLIIAFWIKDAILAFIHQEYYKFGLSISFAIMPTVLMIKEIVMWSVN